MAAGGYDGPWDAASRDIMSASHASAVSAAASVAAAAQQSGMGLGTAAGSGWPSSLDDLWMDQSQGRPPKQAKAMENSSAAAAAVASSYAATHDHSMAAAGQWPADITSELAFLLSSSGAAAAAAGSSEASSRLAAAGSGATGHAAPTQSMAMLHALAGVHSSGGIAAANRTRAAPVASSAALSHRRASVISSPGASPALSGVQPGNGPPSSVGAARGATGAPSSHGESQAAGSAFLHEEAQREAMAVYFMQSHDGTHSDDQTLSILHSRVVQKSYGTEKRFFCPPPAVRLKGARWSHPRLGPLKSFVNMDARTPDTENHELELDKALNGFAKALYITDTDKRKSFALHVKLFHLSGHDHGTFRSKPIKVISKPSKKKQSVKTNPDICIEYGSEIALFSRVRSQSGSTRYLTCNGAGSFVVNNSSWDTFKVYPADTPVASLDTVRFYGSNARFVLYGDDVILKCMHSGAIMRVTLRKIEKNQTEQTTDDPISQLQKVAVFKTSSERDYLSLSDRRAVFAASKTPDPKPGSHKLPETASWTICSCDRIVYTFYNPRFLGPEPSFPATPVPVVSMSKTLGKVVELYGEQFSTLLTVYFDAVPAETWYRCEELLMCHPPEFGKLSRTGETVCTAPMTVDLFLVRKDGFIYRTGQSYTYDVDHIALIRSMTQQRQAPSQADNGGDLGHLDFAHLQHMI